MAAPLLNQLAAFPAVVPAVAPAVAAAVSLGVRVPSVAPSVGSTGAVVSTGSAVAAGCRVGAGDAVGAIVGAAVGSGALDQQPVHMDMAAIAAITINMRFIEYASLTLFIDEHIMCGWAQKNAPIGTFFC